MELHTPDLLAGVVGRLDTLDGGVVAVNEEGLPAGRERILELQRVLVVLAGDVDAAGLDGARRGESEDGLVVATVAERHTVCVQACGDADDLVSHTDAEHGLGPLLERLAEVHRGFRAVVRVARPVRQEQAIVLVTDLVEVVVPRQDGDGGAAAHERAQDVRLCAEVEHCDLDVAAGVQHVGFLGGDLVDKVLLRRIPKFVFSWCRGGRIGADGEAAEGSTLIAQEASDGTSVHAGDTWHTVALAPLGEGFDGEVMGKLFGDICNDDRRALDALRFEVDTDVVAIDWCLVVGNSVVADERCCKNEDLSPV